MRLGEIGTPRAEASLETACPAGELPDIRGVAARQILGDRITHQLGHRTIFDSRPGLQGSCLFSGQLNLSAYHVVMIMNQPA